MKKIAFCYLIYDIINQEELWNNFFKNINKDKYNIYIHYKTNKELKYFNKYKLNNCINTNYTDQTIIHAYNILFKTAYELDNDNYKFIIISQSCIPLKSFDYIYDHLTKDNKGYFNECPVIQCYPNCNNLLNYIDKQYISKSHNWFILNRELILYLAYIEHDIIDILYNDIYAPAEYFYYTFIKKNNMENHICITNNLSIDATTFTYWKGMDYVFDDITLNGLKNYSNINLIELEYLLNSKSLFGRKFEYNCKINNSNENFELFISNIIN